MTLKKIEYCILLLAFITAGCNKTIQKAELKPDSLYVLSFPALPVTMFNQIIDSTDKTKMSFYLPKDYSMEREFPLLLWINGSTGGPGTNIVDARKLSRDSGFICVNLPLFIDSLAPLKADSGNYWDRMYVNGATTIKKNMNAYRIMLDSVFCLVPNIDRKHCYMGGFSNGAHVTAGILNFYPDSIKKYFSGFYFMEGGGELTNYSVLKNIPVLIMFGDNHGWGPKQDEQMLKQADSIFKNLKAEGAGVEILIGKGIGHETAPLFMEKLRSWLLNESLK